MVKKMKLMAEYGGTVLWNVDPSTVGPIDVNTLPISEDLKSAIQDWADFYDQTFNENDPGESAFHDFKEATVFESEGRRIWRELQRELGKEYQIKYYSEQESRLLD